MEENRSAFRGTTIVAVQKDGKTAVAGDGQVTMGETTIMKHGAQEGPPHLRGEGRRGLCGLRCGRLCPERKASRPSLEQFAAATCPAPRWSWRRTGACDKGMRQLQAMLLAADKDNLLLISGTGEVIDAGRRRAGHRLRRQITRSPPRARSRREHGPCRPRRSSARRWRSPRRSACTPMTTSRSRRCEHEMNTMTPRQIVEELDKLHHRPGRGQARRRHRAAQPLPPLPAWTRRSARTSPRRTSSWSAPRAWARPRSPGRLAKLVDAPLVKVEATKFTEVGYVGRDVDSIVRDLVEASHPPGQGAHGQGRGGRPPSRAPRSAPGRADRQGNARKEGRRNPIDIAAGPGAQGAASSPEEREKPQRTGATTCSAQPALRRSWRTRSSRSRSRTHAQQRDPARHGRQHQRHAGRPDAQEDKDAHASPVMRGAQDPAWRRRPQKLIDMDEARAARPSARRRGGRHRLHRRDRQGRGPLAGRRPRRLPRGRAARHPAHRGGLHGQHQVRPGQDRPHALHRGRRLPRRQGDGPDPRAAGPLPRAGGR